MWGAREGGRRQEALTIPLLGWPQGMPGICDPSLLQCAFIWRGQNRSGALARYAAVQPAECPLPHLGLSDVVCLAVPAEALFRFARLFQLG